MNWDYIISVLPRFVDATLITLALSFWGILCSFIIGTICAVINSYHFKALNWLVKSYIELSRNTPLLIQVFFLYFGLSKVGIKLDGFTCGVIGLAFLGGSYMAEAIRGGLEAVSKGQIESALSIGLTPFQAFRYVIFPQALAISIPAIGANCLFLMKETSVISAVAVAELMFIAKEIIGMDYKTNEALFLLVVFYLIILLPISISIRYLEQRTRRAKYGI
ncbi:amino acid ABC transporter [Rodentibacter caecimuris]|uniref:Amino acid ABC transporter n=1 Tax=Rodentibacter caecimuris TaxID=1796644 RepID=A0AAJ3K415_9PAST|nr:MULTISPECIES: amino acid ABC transporter permease [Pasteurellaceae]AOF54177.1 ABC transporter membrane-spanning permease - glutamine transport [Pasteurellaceae bacterium NI1060]MCR1836765.1 amino acid ABC transporter permease [Pasteurella caecimuris]MCU0106020.1 amino acid ABC transporter permease [Pasteurella caecimuris]OOF72065.1 amino acid ABC transporter [Rodentibacter heylii]OOF73636.1 amino acid ABC transporter [Rodentibacter heylii]